MTLSDFMDFVCACAKQSGHSFSDDFADELARQIVQQRPGERIYIPTPDHAKVKDIKTLAKRLPADVVAQRCGVTKRWVNKCVSRRE